MEPSENYYLQVIARQRLDLVDLIGATADESRELVSTLVGVSITKMERYPAEPPVYLLTVGNDKTITLGDSNSFLNQQRFRGVLIDYMNHNMDVFKTAEWRQIISRMLEFIEDLPGSDEATHLGAATQWLATYIRDHIRAERVEEAQRIAILERKPGIMEDDDWFSMARLRGYVKKEFGETLSAGDLSVRLKQIGCQFVDQKSFRTEEANHCRSLWRVGKAWPTLKLKGLERPVLKP